MLSINLAYLNGIRRIRSTIRISHFSWSRKLVIDWGTRDGKKACEFPGSPFVSRVHGSVWRKREHGKSTKKYKQFWALFLFTIYELRRDTVRSGEWLKTAGEIRRYASQSTGQQQKKNKPNVFRGWGRCAILQPTDSLCVYSRRLPDACRGETKDERRLTRHNCEYRRMKMRWDKCTQTCRLDSRVEQIDTSCVCTRM